VKPAAIGLRHTHAVTEVRLAVQRTSSYRRSRAWWRSERSILAGESFPARIGHVPDAEVHYPADSGMPWAGETWAVEVELSRKTVKRTAAIMAEVLARTTDYVRLCVILLISSSAVAAAVVSLLLHLPSRL
jgi:hypothetical protein